MPLADAYQDGTDEALKVLAARPAEPPVQKQSSWTDYHGSTGGFGGFLDSVADVGMAASAAIPAGVEEVAGNLQDVVNASYTKNLERAKARGYAPPVGPTEQEMTQGEPNPYYPIAQTLAPDPATAGKAEQITFGLTKGLAKAIGAVSTMGPIPGAIAFGTSEGITTEHEMKAAGVDDATASKVAAATGLGSGASLLLPVVGSTISRSIALMFPAAGSYMLQMEANKKILEHANYDELAQRYDPLDPLGLALSVAPGGLIAAGMHGMRALHVEPKIAGAETAPNPEAPNPEAPAQPQAETAAPSQDEIDAVMTHNMTLQKEAIQSVPPEARTVPSDEAVPPPSTVGETIQEHLESLGTPTEEAQAKGQLWNAFFNSRWAADAAAREGITPKELFDRYYGGVISAAKEGGPEVLKQPFAGPEVATTPIEPGMTHIDIGGTERPATNSNGQPIHWSEEGTRNFWNWFGDSKAVDDKDQPLVVYHGTGADFNQFQKSDGGTFGDGIYLTKSRSEASIYSGSEDDELGGQIYPVYVSIKHPASEAVASEVESKFGSRTSRELARLGYDGIIAGDEVIAFDPKQIKSATGNGGEFNPKSKNILHQSSRSDDLQSQQERIAKYAQELGYEIDESHRSGLSGSRYLELTLYPGKVSESDTGGSLDRAGNEIYPERLKIRISDHALPPTYGLQHGFADFEVSPRGAEHQESNGNWLDALEWLSKKAGKPIPIGVRAAFARSKKNDIRDQVTREFYEFERRQNYGPNMIESSPIWRDVLSKGAVLFKRSKSGKNYVATDAAGNVVFSREKPVWLVDRAGKKIDEFTVSNIEKDASRMKEWLSKYHQFFDGGIDATVEREFKAWKENAGGAFDARSGNILAQPAYHGSPHDFDKFSMDKIGTGEGAQAYGHGLYFAENPEVAKDYQRALPYNDAVRQFRERLPDDAHLSEVEEMANKNEFPAKMNRVLKALAADDWLGFDYPSQAISAAFKDMKAFDVSPELRKAVEEYGSLYTVDIPDHHVANFLDWDKPLSEQPVSVRKTLESLGVKDVKPVPPKNIELAAIIKKALSDNDSNPRNLELVIDNDYGLYQRAQKLAEKQGLSVDETDLGEFIVGQAKEYVDALIAKQENTGEAIYKAMGDSAEASKKLNELGIKGIKYLDAGSRSAGEGSSNLVVFDDSIIKLTHKDGTPVTPKERDAYFQPMAYRSAATNMNRGYLEFGRDGKMSIAMLSHADKSTFLHESGHFFLEVMSDLANHPEAPTPLKADMNAVYRWMGLKNAEAWNKMSLAEKRPYHEQWARGFESYLRDGNAPTAGLKATFARFRDWLLEIYRSATDLNVTLSSEVRTVMDEMLTSEKAHPSETARAPSGDVGTPPHRGAMEAPALGSEHSPELDQALASGRPNLSAPRSLTHPDIRRELIHIASNEAGWAEVGGKLIRNPNSKVAGDEMISRTHWIPRSEWWPDRPDKLNESQVAEAIRKALAGEKLKVAESRTVEYLRKIANDRLDAAQQMGTEEFGNTMDEVTAAAHELGSGLEPTTENIFDSAAIGRAMEDNPEAYKIAADRYNVHDDDALFMGEIRSILDEHNQAKIDIQARANPDTGGQERGGAPAEASKSTGAEPTDPVAREAERIAAEAPDRPVALRTGPDGVQNPITTREYLDTARAEVAQIREDASLYAVAADCLLGQL